MRILTRTIWILSLVSLVADVASEMLYPVIPVYLKQIGFSVLLIGTLEGVVNFVAGISKGSFGAWSDRKGSRLPFVQWGYLLSALSKPLLGLTSSVIGVFLVRTTDRLGKGVRTAARDAMLAQEASPENRGRVFGFHRGMDTFGAALGPLLALAFLYAYPREYKTLFLLAFIPGILSVLMTFLIREKKFPPLVTQKKGFLSYFHYWKRATPNFRKVMPGFWIFLLFNSADFFLILFTRTLLDGQHFNWGQVQLDADTATIAVYIFYNLVYAGSAPFLGSLADKMGYKPVLIGGFFLYAMVYAGLASNPGINGLLFLFGCYGLYAGATEGLIKAWISNQSATEERGTALGFFSSTESIGALGASILAGFIWNTWGPVATFITTAVAAIIAAGWLWVYLNSNPISRR
ncbi:MAG: MFS transporter [Bacteroidetes bacterium]|nr:MFS transporter [Bacteroidota bacterium]